MPIRTILPYVMPFLGGPYRNKLRVSLCCDESRGIRWVGHVAHMGEKKSTEFWVENLKERDCEGCRHRWEDNINIDIKKIGGVHCLD
jgi:hypothetical protein